MSSSEVSRRQFLGTAGAAAAGAAVGQTGFAATADAKKGRGRKFPHPKNPDEALKLLKEGNRRYRSGKLELRDYSPIGERQAAQKPFASIISCADSRISPTLIFDVERGNLFNAKIAGNSIDTGTLGSTEYGVGVLGAKVIVVLGHSECGAIKAGIDVANGTASYPPDRYGSIGPVVDLVVPPIKAVPPAQRNLPTCIDANARFQASTIAAKAPIISAAVAAGTVKVVSAVYDIKSGKVSYL